MSEKSTVVIIIPAYHAALTLKRCLSSVEMQTYRQLEIFVVDDGNEDNALKEIVEQFIVRDSRFRYLWQKNQGPGVARNNGLKQVENLEQKWVVFVDSDDYVEPDYVERLLEKALKSNCLMVSSGGIEKESIITGEEAMIAFAKGQFIMGVYDRIVHGSLLLDSPFGTWSQYGEDTFATFHELSSLIGKTICLSSDSFGYHYVDNRFSSTHDPLTPSKSVEYLYLWARIYHEMKTKPLPENCNRHIIRRFDCEYLQMRGYIETNWNSLSDEGRIKYSFAKTLIQHNHLLRRFMPESFGERIRCFLCRFSPRLYCLLFSKP